MTDTGIIIVLNAAVILQLFAPTVAVIIDPYISSEHRKLMLTVDALVFALFLQNDMVFFLSGTQSPVLLDILVAIIGYSIRPVIIVIFSMIVDSKKDNRHLWLLAALNALINLTALFSGIVFSIDPSEGFKRGPLGYSSHIICIILLVILARRTINTYSNVGRSEFRLHIFNLVILFLSVVLDFVFSLINSRISIFFTIAVVSVSLLYYILLHMQFVKEHEKALLAQQRIQIMMSQIQPHFLYNTLSTIQALCGIDPEKAADVTEKFGTYLRQNINSLDKADLIPLEKELEHTRIYADIEMIRFPSISVVYDIADKNFNLPALTIQPMVENAIRHGVRGRKKGIVTVATHLGTDHHAIVIRDNGKGFDVASLEWEHEQSHIGIRNVKERIKELCNGTVEVQSRIDEGTVITIMIPIGGENV